MMYLKSIDDIKDTETDEFYKLTRDTQSSLDHQQAISDYRYYCEVNNVPFCESDLNYGDAVTEETEAPDYTESYSVLDSVGKVDVYNFD
jgi:hypothetical protein